MALCTVHTPIPRPANNLRVRIENFVPAHIPEVLDVLDDESRRDVASTGMELDAAVGAVLAGSKGAWIVRVDGKPAIALGVIAASWLSDEAYIWLLCTNSAGFVFARYAKYLLNMLMERWPRLYGVVSPDRKRALRLVEWAGGRLGETLDIDGEPMVRFRLGA